MRYRAGERRKRGKMDRRSAELSRVIRAALEQSVLAELLPRSQIDVYVQVRVRGYRAFVSVLAFGWPLSRGPGWWRVHVQGGVYVQACGRV